MSAIKGTIKGISVKPFKDKKGVDRTKYGVLLWDGNWYNTIFGDRFEGGIENFKKGDSVEMDAVNSQFGWEINSMTKVIQVEGPPPTEEAPPEMEPPPWSGVPAGNETEKSADEMLAFIDGTHGQMDDTLKSALKILSMLKVRADLLFVESPNDNDTVSADAFWDAVMRVGITMFIEGNKKRY